MAEDSVGTAAVWKAVEEVEWPGREVQVEEIRRCETGVNDVFVFSTGLEKPARAVCKFATFSVPASFEAGATASRFLSEYTELPVPEVYALRSDPATLPAFQVIQYIPGDPLGNVGENPRQARVLGEVIEHLGDFPAEVTDGYGWIERRQLECEDRPADRVRGLEAEYDTCAEWLLEYGLDLYDDLPDHELLTSKAREVPSFLRENSDRFPVDPSPSIVLTDFGLSNLLAADGTVSDQATIEEATGLIDLERAKLGPKEFNAVNVEFLLTRWLDDPEPVVDALYEPLPFGPDVPGRDLYRLLAMGREVTSLDLFYEVGSRTHDQRGDALARAIDRILP